MVDDYIFSASRPALKTFAPSTTTTHSRCSAAPVSVITTMTSSSALDVSDYMNTSPEDLPPLFGKQRSTSPLQYQYS